MSEDVHRCCRLCLDVESDHVPIIGDPTIYLQIKSCLSMTVTANDNLPKNICTSCVAQLSDFYNFQLNARCSEDWLQSQLETAEEVARKCMENKVPVKPLPDSEYNSDSLLEFLNNTANIEEYLNNLGKEHIPSIVNILDRNQERSDIDGKGNAKIYKPQNSKIKEVVKNKSCVKMEIDVLDSHKEIVKEILKKESEPKKASQFPCSACKIKFDSIQKLSQHLTVCNFASWACPDCNIHFDSKDKLLQHITLHKLPASSDLRLNKTGSNNLTSGQDPVYRCKQCNMTFGERFEMYKHAKSHVLKDEERSCDICGQKLIGNEALIKHKSEVHGSLNNPLYRCKVCQHTSTDRKVIYLHVQEHVQKQEDNKQLCDSCGKSFSTKATLQRHILKHAVTYKCTICKETFCDAPSKQKHMFGHIDTNIMCEKCGYISSDKCERHNCVDNRIT